MSREEAPHLGPARSHQGSASAVVFYYGPNVELGKLGQGHGLPLSDVSVGLHSVKLSLGEVYLGSKQMEPYLPQPRGIHLVVVGVVLTAKVQPCLAHEVLFAVAFAGGELLESGRGNGHVLIAEL